MSWPNADQCERGVDLSYYQRTLNVADFVAKNPTVARYVIRAVWPNQTPDQAFRGLHDALQDAGEAPGAYFWPNPSKTLGQMKAAWKAAIGSRVPAFVVVDCEWSQAQWKNAGVTPIRTITEDTRETLRMAVDMFGENVIIYTRGLWWDENIREHGWEKDYKFWIAHYPVWWGRQALRFEEMEERLPITGFNNYWPNIGSYIPPENVIGWQASDHGRLPGYDGNLDLSLWLKPPKPTLEQTVADHEVRIAALEAR